MKVVFSPPEFIAITKLPKLLPDELEVELDEVLDDELEDELEVELEDEVDDELDVELPPLPHPFNSIPTSANDRIFITGIFICIITPQIAILTYAYVC